MKPWYRYQIKPKGRLGYRRSSDKWEQNYPDLKIGINKESFIGDQLIGPYFFWEQFARRYIKKDDHILSIGSGPCINELAVFLDIVPGVVVGSQGGHHYIEPRLGRRDGRMDAR